MSASGDEANSSIPPPDPSPRQGPLRGLLDRLLGYDYFISYSHGDGMEYPAKLAKRLGQSGFRVFLDASEYHAGVELVSGTRRRVRMSTYLVLVAGPHSMRSDWVLRELENYVVAGRPPIVINVNNALATPDANRELLRLLEHRIYIPETLGPGEHLPTDGVLAEIRRSFKATRQETRRIRYLAATTVAFGALAFAGFGFACASIWYEREARWETGIARRQTKNALLAEAESHGRLVALYAEAAQVAMRRGAWKAAKADLQRALDANHPDRNGLLLEMVKVKAALYEIAEAETILRTLAGRTDLTAEERGLLLLWQGDFELSKSFSTSEAALKLVRRATEAKLPEAELAYAKGLLATTTGEAVESLEIAVGKDPFHPRANAILALFYLHLGRFEEARVRLLFAEKVFPDNPTYRVIHATTCALEGKQAEADRLLEAARPGLSAGQNLAAKAVVDLYRAMSLINLAEQFDPDVPMSRQVGPYLSMIRMGLRLRNLPTDQDVRFFPIPPLVMGVQARTLGVILRIGLGGDPRKLAGELTELAAAMPDGYFHLLRGMLLFNADRYADAAEAFGSAAANPSILKVREPALYLKAMSEIVAGNQVPGTERKAATAKAVATLKEIEALGEELPASQAEVIATFLIQVGELDLARRIIEEWEARAPADPKLLRKKAALECESGSFGRAIALARKILEGNPSDEEAKRILALAERRLSDLYHSEIPNPPR